MLSRKPPAEWLGQFASGEHANFLIGQGALAKKHKWKSVTDVINGLLEGFFSLEFAQGHQIGDQLEALLYELP